MIEELFSNEDEALDSLLNLLKDKGYPQDKVGNTKLTSIAGEIKKIKSRDILREIFTSAVIKCAEKLSSLSVCEIKKLCCLIQLSEIKCETYNDAYLKAFRKWRTEEKNTEQRAEVFRFLSESEAKLFPNIIKKQTEIKNEFPWHWIDATVFYDWNAANEEIKNQLAKGNIEPLLLRLPSFYNLKGGELGTIARNDWFPILEEADKGKVIIFFKRIGLQVENINENEANNIFLKCPVPIFGYKRMIA